MRLRIPPPPRSGELVIGLEGVHKSYGDTHVYRGTDFELHRGQRVALAGPNGAGKSTLLRILGGVLDIDSGERRVGHNVSVAFFAQHQLEALSPKCSVLEELAKSATTDDIPRLRGHLGAFLFSGDDVEKKVAVLSGGEKQRLALAKLLLRPANLLVLDEPTNHLDIAACEVLERALGAYTGTFVFVSHDRSFINSLANKVVEVRKGVLREFTGNYDDYERKLRESDERAAAKPEPAAAGQAAAKPKSVAPTPSPTSRPKASAPRRSKQERVQERQQERDRQKARQRITKRIERIEAEILDGEQAQEALVYKLGDPEVHRDRERAAALEAERVELQVTIDAAYRDWERLAVELEALDDVS
jgi:ATP-binding cassette subfamily F protein 3